MMFRRCKKLIRGHGAKVTASQDWKQETREALLAEIRRSPVWRQARMQKESSEKNLGLARFLPDYRLIFKPLGMAAMIVVLVFSGSVATVSAARSSLPGDVFYPVKIGLERAQIGLALSLEKKAELEIAFAGTRLREVQEIIDKESSSENKGQKSAANIEQAISHLAEGLDSVQRRLDQIKKSSNVREAVGISKLVNDNALLLEENLLQLKGRITQDQAKDETRPGDSAVDKSLATIDQALVKLDETNTKSLTVMVEKALVLQDNRANEEAAAKLQTTIERMEKKIEVTEQKIDSVSQSIGRVENFKLEAGQDVIKKDQGLSGDASSVAAMLSNSSQASTTAAVVSPEVLKQVVREVENKPEEAKKMIEDAKNLLKENDVSKLGDVLIKVQETNSIVQDTRNKLRNAEFLQNTR